MESQQQRRTEQLVVRLSEALKRYLHLQREYALLVAAEKLTRLLTALILGAAVFVLGIVAVVFAGLALAAFLAWVTGSTVAGYAIVAALIALTAYVLYRMRERWLMAPIANFLAHVLINDEEQQPHESE